MKYTFILGVLNYATALTCDNSKQEKFTLRATIDEIGWNGVDPIDLI